MPTFVRKSFHPKILKWQKVSYQEKKIEKVQICQNAPRPLSGLDKENSVFFLLNYDVPARDAREFSVTAKKICNRCIMNNIRGCSLEP